MKLNRLITLVLFGIALLATAGTDIPSNTTEQPDGRTILEKTLSAPVPTSFGAVYDITHTDHHDRKKERRALLFFAVDDKDPLVRKQVISFLEPRDLKGTALLTENRMGWGEDYSSKSWIYNPLFRRTKLNSISNWRNRQFGSSMSVFDGLHHDLNWFKAENKGMEKIGDRNAWKLEITVDDSQVQERSNYGRITRWVDVESFQTVKMEIFNTKDELVKTADVKLLNQDGFWLLDEMTVSLIRADGRKEVTTVNISNYKLNPETVTDGLFSQRALERGIPLGLQKEILEGK